MIFFSSTISKARGCAPGFCISFPKWLSLSLAQLITSRRRYFFFQWLTLMLLLPLSREGLQKQPAWPNAPDKVVYLRRSTLVVYLAIIERLFFVDLLFVLTACRGQLLCAAAVVKNKASQCCLSHYLVPASTVLNGRGNLRGPCVSYFRSCRTA